jgi:peptidoglycan/xylan/chitin deacetylase (PgdA/CDA1 family)
MGYEAIQWSVDSLDWQGIGKEAIIDRVLKNIQPGAIVLFHNNAEYTPEALPVILDTLQQEGYQIVPVSELLLKGDYYIEQHSGIQKKKGGQAPDAKPSLVPVTPLPMQEVLTSFN